MEMKTPHVPGTWGVFAGISGDSAIVRLVSLLASGFWLLAV